VQINIHKPAVFLQDNLLNLASRTPNNDELQALFGKHIPSSEEKLLFARFFSTGFLGGKKFEVVNTHTDTDTTSQFDRLSCENLSENSNFVFPKLPT